ncbi:hypothetical protein [Amycolatopsis samaneae]|uniref:Uncharacterized protein n=1 Tax=Amycolatopsis samaneae TaxID=664691 RepID=A0ABW5GET5_9PSEU
MSFDLAVLAMSAPADLSSAHQMFESCTAAEHAEGEIDERITLFYEQLRAVFPDSGSEAARSESPWMSTPLEVGIDHVIMRVGSGPVGTTAIETVLDLASRNELAVYDPQSDDVYLPDR